VALAQAGGGVSNGLTASNLRSEFGIGGLNGATTLSELILGIIMYMLLFAGSIAVIFVIIGGFQYVTSGGNEEQAEKGRKTLINAVIGIVIIVLAYVIINVVANLVGGLG
jgi:hypothetical protein